MNLFISNLDYIFFIYGVAFILLGLICYVLHKSREATLPWLFLGLFGFSHGANEWLDMLAIRLGGNPGFTGVRLAIMALSFIFLFEFGRKALKDKRSVLLYVPLLILAVSGYAVGPAAFNATIRYSFGFFGGIFASYALFRGASVQNGNVRYLYWASGTALTGYAIASGLIGPAAGFFPASFINHDIFFSLARFPIQLLRCVLAIIISFFAGGIYVHGQRAVYGVRATSDIYRKHLVAWRITFMALFIVVGWIFTGILGNIGLKYDRQRICSVMDVLREPIIAITRISDQLAETMSGSPNFAALSGPDQMTYLDKMDSTVDRYSRAIPGSICYILDKNGVTVTSSNRLEKDSFTGKNYGFRPYFRKAMNGEKSSYIAMGVTSKLPGYYSAAPVHGPGNEVIGAAVIKLDLGGELQKALAIGRFTVSLVHSSGYSIASSDGALAAKPLWPVEKKVWEDILASKQFPDFSGEPLLKAKPGNGDMFPVKKALTLFSVENSGIEGVMLVGMTPPDGYSIFRLAGIVVLLMILLIFSFLSIAAENKMSADIKMKEYDLKIETIAETAVDGLVMTDREGVILFWNRTAESMFGYSRREALGKDLFGLAVPDGSPELRRSVLPRSVENVRGMEKGMVTEIPCTRQNGEKFPAEMSFAAVESDGKWQAVGLIKDITERKKTEDALRESEKRFMDILYSSKDAILLIDGNAFVDCNDATAHMLKYPKREDFLMTHPSELSPPKQPDGRDSFEKANDMMRTALEKGFHRFEWTHKKAGGEVFPVEVSLTPITMKGRNILHCVWRDLTGAKLEEKEKKERMHELEVFYKASVEREERIIELKEELRKLREKLGCMGL